MILSCKLKAISVMLMLTFFAGQLSWAATLEKVGADENVLHVLNRLTFGPRPGDVDAVSKMGINRFIDFELHPESIQQPRNLTDYLNSLDLLTMSPPDLLQKYGAQALTAMARSQSPGDVDPKEAAKKLREQTYRNIYQEMTEARLRQSVESSAQLQEVMTEFWFNHFNVSFGKGGVDHALIGSYEQEAIRPYALGKFGDLVDATCHHAAMLFYLDNWQNSAPNSASNFGPRQGKVASKFQGLNENYARELMELHTLGVDGGYTQQDVIALARILTGLGLPGRRALDAGPQSTKFGCYFDVRRHDFGDKQFLGHTIKGSGHQEIEEAIGILIQHPSTAHHICYQLAQYFVADDPPKALVDHLSATFMRTRGDIRVVLSDLFHSPEFWDKRYFNNKYKNPYHYVVSTLRAADISLADYQPIVAYLNQLGMPLYKCLTPDGYKNTQDAWLNPDSVLRRISFATAVASGKLPRNQLPPQDVGQLESTLGYAFSPSTTSAIDKAPDQLKASLVLGSPDFMKF